MRMLLISGLALVSVGLWEELIGQISALQEDEDVIYYAMLTFVQLMGRFLMIIYAVAHVYGE